MRDHNVSENLQWSYPGFRDSQVDTSTPALIGDDQGVPYAIWSIKVNTSSLDAGKKSATCEFQQENLPMSIDFQFLIIRKTNRTPDQITLPGTRMLIIYDLGGYLDEKDITQQVEDEIKRQISEYYNIPASSVTRSRDGQKLVLTIMADTAANTTISSNILALIGVPLLVLLLVLLVCLGITRCFGCCKKKYGAFPEHYGGRASIDTNPFYGECEEYYRQTRVADENEMYGYGWKKVDNTDQIDPVLRQFFTIAGIDEKTLSDEEKKGPSISKVDISGPDNFEPVNNGFCNPLSLR